MKRIFINNKKIFFVVLPLFFIVYFVYLALFQLNTLVSLGVRIFTHGTMKMEKVVFKEGSSIKEGRIEILNSQLYDKGELIADTPRILIDYKNWKIERINIYNSKAVFVRKGSDVNFVTVFTGPSKDENKNRNRSDREKEEKRQEKKNKKDPILKRINVYNADLNYVDISYSQKISQNVKNVNGYVQFEKGYKVDLKFTGNNEEEKYSYTFENIKKSYDMRIDLENIQAQDTLVQYGYDSDGEIKDVTGLYNMDLRINDDGFFGYGKLENGTLRYEDLNTTIKDVQLDLQFLGEKIIIDGDYLFFDKKGKFLVEYNSGKGVDVDFKLKDVFFNEIATYKIIEDTGLKIDNLMLDTVDINLSVKDHFKAQIDFKSNEGFKQNVADISQIDGQFVYENGSVKINNLLAKVRLDKEGKIVERDISAKLDYRNDTGKVVVDVHSPKAEFLSDVNLSFLFSVKKESLDFKLDSNIIDLTGKYDFNSKFLSLNQKNNFKMLYNFENNHIDVLEGNIVFQLEQYTAENQFKTDDGYRVEINSKIYDKENRVRGTLEGYGDIKSSEYEFKIMADEINLKNPLGSIAGNAEGHVKGRGNEVNGEFFLDRFSVGIESQNLNVSDVLGTVIIEKGAETSVIFQGEIGKIKYAENEINGFKVSAKYSDNTVEILNAANKFLTLNGKYSIINSTLEFYLKGNNLNKDIVNISNIDYNIEEIAGNISGKLNDLNGKFTVNKGIINLGENKIVSFGGDINYLKNKISAKNFKINENRLSFDYYLDTKIGEYSVDIFETMLSEFILGMKFRVIGESKGFIKDNKISGNFKGSVNEFYYKGNKIPNVLFEGDYDNENIVFKSIDILSSEDQKLIRTEGEINIKEKTFDFLMPKQSVPVREILERRNIDGKIDIEGKIGGTFDNFTYQVKGSDGNILYKDILINKIGIDLTGDKENAVLEGFTASYLNNSIKSDGVYNISENTYKFNVNSSDIDMRFLSVFLDDYGIDDISGNGKINLVITDVVPEGEILLDNFNISAKKYGVDLKNLNGDFALDKGFLRIKKFKGNMNNGTININGYVEAAKAVSQLLGENFEKIDYNLSLEGKNIDYFYEDYFNINLDANLRFRRNGVVGSVIINEGKIEKILDSDFGVVTIVKNFIRNFLRRTKSERMAAVSTRESLLNNESVSDLRINVRFNIDKGIDINVNKATNFFTNIRGTVLGQGRLSGNLGKLNFLGETSIKDGEFSLNGNKFTVDRAMILFNNRNEYVPDLNPDIVFATNSIINNKNLEITLTGPMRNLTFTVKSGNEVSINSLDSVLSGNGIEGDGNNNLSILFTNIIGGQISDIIINPIVSILRNIGFSNLNVRSSILAEERRRDLEEESSMVFGAYIEAESPIYKDKLFWKVKANFMGDSTDATGENNNYYNYGVADYDINVYNRINNNLSWGVGVQRLRENMDTRNRDMNYYIELKFEKKFNF